VGAGAKRALVLLAEGFEEMEAVAPIDVLRRAGVTVVAAGLADGPVRGSRGVVVVPDVPLAAVLHERFDAVVLPGGLKGAENLRDDPRVRDLVARTLAGGGIVGAICAAPALVLAAHGFLTGRRATCHPSCVEDLPAGTHAAGQVVRDGPFVTGQAAGAALPFALALVTALCGEERAREVAGPLGYG
jgi:4-methyl-5(b-hydroxyethyl)-thiazole monophosphate biosynthesis